MSSHSVYAPPRLPALRKLVLAAIAASVLSQAAKLALAGQVDPEIGLGIGFLLAAGVLVVTRWRWAPLVAVVLVVVPIIGGLPYLLDHLAHPGDFGFFATTVVDLTCAVAAVVGGIAATIRGYRGDYSSPPWLVTVLTGLVGFAGGALFIGCYLATQPSPAVALIGVDGAATVRMGPVSFEVDQAVIPQGGKIVLVNDGAFPHVIANGLWVGGTAQPAREPNAPAVERVEVNGAAETIEIGPFAAAGTYQLYCPIHTGMDLTVIVE